MKQKVTLIQSVWIVIITLTCATLLILISGASPIEAISLFFNGIFGSLNGSMEVFVKATPLIFTGLACAVAFRTGFFNIGAEGQFYIGALASAFVVLQFDSVSGVGRILLAFIAGFIGGGIWALIAAFLKSKFGISEIIVTIMLNYIAINIVGIAVRTFMMDPNGNLPQSAKIEKSVCLMQVLKPTRLHIGFFIAIAVVILVWIVLEKTTIGYELRAVGYNKRGAACNGISITKNIILSSFLSGGLAAFAGVIEVLAIQKKLVENISADCGFTGILIALLAKNHPIGVLFVAIFYASMQVGASSMQRQMGIPSSIVNILMGLIVILILGKQLIGPKKKKVREEKVC